MLAAVWVWKPTATRRAFASLLVLGGLLCKEVALAGVCVVIVLEFTQHQVPRLSRAVRCIWPVTAVSAYIALRQAALGFQTPTSEGIALGQRPRLVLEALGRYALMTIDACRPRAQIGYVQDPAWGFVVLGICVAVALVVAAVVLLRRRDQRKLVAFTLLVTSIALACHIVPISLANVCCDRFLYLPTVGLVLLAATGTRATPKWVTILAFVVLACFVKVTARCAQRWADPIALWTETCTHPASRSGIALLELGNLEMNAGNYQRAMRIFSANPVNGGETTRYLALGNQALAALRLGQYDYATQILTYLTQQQPDVPKYWYDLATMHIRNFDFTAARRALLTALELMPNYKEARRVLNNLPLTEQASQRFRSSELSISERAVLANLLGLIHEAEDTYLQVLPRASTYNERQAALAFIAQMGSDVGVRAALGSSGQWRDQQPQLYASLVDRHATAQRLARIPLSSFGIY